MQNYLPNVLPGKRTPRMVTGDQGEGWCVKNLTCLSCGEKDFSNLNDHKKNMVGVDIQCGKCGEYGQVKTFKENPNGTSPIKQKCKGKLWDKISIPSHSNTLRITLKNYKDNIRYYCVIYKDTLHGKEVQYVAITEPLSLKNMHRGEKAIIANETKWICRI